MTKRLFAVLLLVLPLMAQAVCTRALRVPFEDWEPYSFIDAEGRHTGLETELLAAVTKEVGCRVRYVRDVPRNRRMPLLMAGELDLLIAATPVARDAQWAWYTRPYRDEVFGAFMRAAEVPVEARSLEDLLAAGLRLVTHRGPVGLPVVREFEARGRLTWFEDYAKGVELMVRDRGDVLLGDAVAIGMAARNAGVALEPLPFDVTRGPVTYKLSRQSMTEAQLEAFNLAIERLEARGELQRIRQRWLGQALKPAAR